MSLLSRAPHDGPSAPARPRRPLWLRALGWLAGLLLGLELVYLVLANLFLNVNGLRWAFASTNQVNAKIAGGWSVIPGRVHVRTLRITFQDKNLQFSIDLAHASLELHLLELVHRTFHASHVRGDGVAFHLRHRVDPWSKNEPAVGAFAPFPEFPGPAVFEAFVPEPPISDAAYKLWTIHLDDVDVHVAELWVQAFRYRGAGRARGAFQLRPARTLWVSPASLELEPGRFDAGAYSVAPGLRGRIDCTVHPFDVRKPQGMEVFRFISTRIWLAAPAFDPQASALFAAQPAPLVSAVGGSLQLLIAARHGVLTAPTELAIVQHNFELRAARGDLQAERLEVRGGLDDTGGVEGTLLIRRGTVKEPIAPGHAPGIDYASLSLSSNNRDLTRGFDLAEVRLGELRLTLGDSSWLNRWVKGRNFTLSGGRVSLTARGAYKDKLVSGEAWLESDEVRGLAFEKRVRYAGALALRGQGIDPEAFTGHVSADLTGHALRAELGAASTLDLAGLRVRVVAERNALGNQAEGQAELWSLATNSAGIALRAPKVIAQAHTAQAADGAQITSFSAQIPALSIEGRGARLTSAALARGTFAQPKNKPEKSLKLWASLIEPRVSFGRERVNAAASERVQVHAALRADAASALSGTIELSPAAWQVIAGNLRAAGKSALSATLRELNLQQDSGSVEARLSSSEVTLGDTTQNADCPWSRVQALSLDGSAELRESAPALFSLDGNLAQAELNWGDFLTHADIALHSQFDQGLLAEAGNGSFAVTFRNAALRSGAGGQSGWSTNVPRLELQANLARKAGKLAGSASLVAHAARGRIGHTRLSTDLSADFELDTLNVAARSAHGSGALHVRHAALPNVPDPITNWWADVKLDSIFGRAAQNLELGGMFRANLRDATPGLAVLASQGSLPKWVASVLPLDGLKIVGSIARRCRLTDIHLVDARGGPAVARGRLQSLPDGFQGALLLRVAGLSALSAGVDFDDRHTSFGLFDGDAWLSRFEQHFDRKSANAAQLSCPPDPNRCTAPEAQSVASEPD